MKIKLFNFLKKLIDKINLSKIHENRIRRVVEISTFVSGLILIIVALFKVLFFSGTFMNNMIEFTVGLIALNISYRGLVEDLPKVGALVSKRRFWE